MTEDVRTVEGETVEPVETEAPTLETVATTEGETVEPVEIEGAPIPVVVETTEGVAVASPLATRRGARTPTAMIAHVPDRVEDQVMSNPSWPGSVDPAPRNPVTPTFQRWV